MIRGVPNFDPCPTAWCFEGVGSGLQHAVYQIRGPTGRGWAKMDRPRMIDPIEDHQGNSGNNEPFAHRTSWCQNAQHLKEPPMQPLGSPYWGHRSITSQVEMEEEEDEAEAMDTAGWTCSLVDVFFPVCFWIFYHQKKEGFQWTFPLSQFYLTWHLFEWRQTAGKKLNERYSRQT